MLDGLLARLEIRLVCFVTRLKPGDVLRSGNRLGGRAVLSVADASRAAVAGNPAILLRSWSWRRSHLHDVGQSAGRKVFPGAVAVATPLPVMFFPLLDGG